jgi:hypothetical protein
MKNLFLILLSFCIINIVQGQTMYSGSATYQSNDIYASSYTYKTVNGNNYTYSIHPTIYNPQFQTDYIVTHHTNQSQYNYWYEYDNYNPSLIQLNQSGVSVDIYNNADSLISSKTTDSYCTWEINHDGSIIIYTEYNFSNKLINEINFSIIGFKEDSESLNYLLRSNDTEFTAMFWKNGSGIVYFFEDSYVIMHGSINY